MNKLDRFASMLGGLIPMAWILTAIHNLHRSGFSYWRENWFWGILTLLLAAAYLWIRHASRTRHPRILALVLSAGLLLAACRVNWVVGTKYDHMGDMSYAKYLPAPSPLWSPPTPGGCVVGATSWRQFPFFSEGGGGGPTEDPQLHVDWPITLGLLSMFLVLVYGFCRLLMRPHTSSQSGETPAAAVT